MQMLELKLVKLLVINLEKLLITAQIPVLINVPQILICMNKMIFVFPNVLMDFLLTQLQE